jgi:ATP-dependent Lon protease
MAVPLIVGRERSVSAAASVAIDGELVLVSQRDGDTDRPEADALHEWGTVAVVLQKLHLPDGTIKVLVEGRVRAKILSFVHVDPFFAAEIERSAVKALPSDSVEALIRSVQTAFQEAVKLGKSVSPDTTQAFDTLTDPGEIADLLAPRLGLKAADRQALLATLDPVVRLEKVLEHLEGEAAILKVERKIKSRVKRQMERSQKEYYLNERMQAIQKELGDRDELANELAELEHQIAEKSLPDEAAERLIRELRKLKMMPPMAAEATVVRNYIDWMLSLPWGELGEENLDITNARKVFDEDHYGLRKVKDRILEYLAVSSLVDRLRGPILCLVGPPGVGKTSLAKSVARATEREFVRLSLGGVRDEAEIRGHRRTYIGALPGKLIQSLRKAGTGNPVFLLDEIDKMSSDFRGDPASALLEVLDPEQNHAFQDHYLNVDYDLSTVMFVCTANSVQGIPPALLDRLEIIRLAGYTEVEKLAIAKQYLLDKQLEANGLTSDQMTITRAAVEVVIREYTREAGVRNLERELASICRKVAMRVVTEGPDVDVRVTSKNVRKILGVPKFSRPEIDGEAHIGLVRGLAVTPWGGEVLEIEVAVVPGKGKLILTGLLGDWLKESGTAAFSYVRSRAPYLGLKPGFHEHFDLHIHYPGNAMKTDGPSAGIAMATALASALVGVPVRHDVAMTGEISLRGRILPIGGLKEKILAAHRRKIKRVLIPAQNEKDLAEIPQEVRDVLEIIPVAHMDQVLDLALCLDDFEVEGLAPALQEFLDEQTLSEAPAEPKRPM